MSGLPQAQARTGFKFMITVRQGPDQGATYQLLPPRVTIGRGVDNNVVFADPRMSRNAATIEFSLEHIVIKDLSSKPSLQVNGQPRSDASIVNGDMIQLGDTHFAFMVEAIPLNSQGQPAALQPVAPLNSPLKPPPRGDLLPFPGAGLPPPSMGAPPPFEQMRPMGNASSSPAASGGGNRLVFYGVLLAAGVGLYLFFNSGAEQKKAIALLRTNEVIEKDIKTSETIVEQIIKKRSFRTEEERTRFEEAQKHYLEGFRDYQKSQWGRAMKSFETANAIDPDHDLARRYYKLAEKQRDEMVALLTLEGRRYKEKSMYTRCAAAFEKVLAAVTNKDDVKYKQAESLKKECELMSSEKYQ